MKCLQENILTDIIGLDIISPTFKRGVKYYFTPNPRLENKVIKGLVVETYCKNNLPIQVFPQTVSPNLVVERKFVTQSVNIGLNWDVKVGRDSATSIQRSVMHDVSIFVTIVDDQENLLFYRVPYHNFFTQTVEFFANATMLGSPNFANERDVNTGLGKGYAKKLLLKDYSLINVKLNKSYVEVFSDDFSEPPYYGTAEPTGNWVIPFNAHI